MRRARDKFRKGERVKMTPLGIQRHLGRYRTGLVVGFGRSPLSVLVLRDGLKTATSYYSGFWSRLWPWED